MDYSSSLYLAAGNFGLNTELVLAQIINFSILAFVLWKFAFKKILVVLDERQKKISDGLQYAEEMKARLADAEKQQADKLKEASEQAAKIVKDAREAAKTFSEKQQQEAVTQAEDIIKKARESTQLEHQQMLAELRKEVTELVVTTTEKVLQKQLSDADKSSFSEAAAKELYASN
jgi:F-type H+-transporting ATPase subunit b